MEKESATRTAAMIPVSPLDTNKTVVPSTLTTSLSPLQVAVRTGDKDFLQLLNETSKKEIRQIVWEAAAYNRADVLTALLTPPGLFDTMKINGLNRNGNTLLIEAIRLNNVAAVTVLCNVRGIDVNLECNGSSPLRLAARKGRHEIVSILLKHYYINVHAEDKHGRSALDRACDEAIKTQIVQVTRQSLPPKATMEELEIVIDAQEAEFYALQRSMKKQQLEHARIVQTKDDEIILLHEQLSTQRNKLKAVLTTALDELTVIA